MAKKIDKNETEVVNVVEVKQGVVKCHILGTTPLYFNQLSARAQRELLLPGRKKNAVERQTTLKHDPREEFRTSAYQFTVNSFPTLLGLPSTAFKGAMMTAALDLPGTKKAVIGRLVLVENDYIHIYGEPRLSMTGVRMADIARTPDIRTRAMVPEWACQLSIVYAVPLMTQQAVLNLLAAAGITCGVGDWRLEKGKGSYGLFKIVPPDDKDYVRITKTGGRKVQEAAMAKAIPADDHSSELLAWYDAEINRRQLKGVV